MEKFLVGVNFAYSLPSSCIHIGSINQKVFESCLKLVTPSIAKRFAHAWTIRTRSTKGLSNTVNGNIWFKHIILLIVISFTCGACVTVTGKSSEKLQQELQQTYFYRSAKRFYPDKTVPNDPSLVSIALIGDNLRPIQEELSETAAWLRTRHETKRINLEKYDLRLTPKISSEVSIVNSSSTAANTTRDGLITIDARVLQSIFLGAVLEAYRASGELSPIHSFAGTLEKFDDSFNPSESTAEQRKAIESLLEAVHHIDQLEGQTVLGDFFSDVEGRHFNTPWFQISKIFLGSIDLEIKYIGAVLFLLAHEQGHLALDHFNRRDSFEKEAAISSLGDKDTRLCQGLRQLELEADVYALLLLSRHTESPESAYYEDLLFNINKNFVGFRNFLQYGYNLSGFAEGENSKCRYETNRARYETLKRLDEALFQKSATAFWKAIVKAVRDVVKPDEGGMK